MDQQVLCKEIALFRSPYDCYITAERHMENQAGYVRVSEYTTVLFPALPHAVFVAAQIAQINEQARKLKADTELKLTDLERKKAELLALPG